LANVEQIYKNVSGPLLLIAIGTRRQHLGQADTLTSRLRSTWH